MKDPMGCASRRWGRFVAIAAAWLLAPVILSAQSSRVTSVDKVADGIWMATTDKGSNASWFLLGEQVIAIDTGSDAETGKAVLEKIRQTTDKPVRYVIVTHAHGDHAGGIVPFVDAGAQIICQEHASPGIAGLLRDSGRHRTNLIAISERLSFLGDVRRVAIYYPGPAHTKGDLVVFLPDDKLLFSGDLALVGRIPYMRSPDVDPKGWEKALERIAALDIDKVVPGHGNAGTQQALIDSLAYVKKVNELAAMMISDKISEDLIEARLRRPGTGIDPEAITPELVGNVRSAMHAALPTPPPTNQKAPEKEKR